MKVYRNIFFLSGIYTSTTTKSYDLIYEFYLHKTRAAVTTVLHHQKPFPPGKQAKPQISFYQTELKKYTTRKKNPSTSRRQRARVSSIITSET